MQSRNLRPAPSGTVTEHGSVHVQSLDDHAASASPQEVPGTGEADPPAADSRVTRPAPAASGQLSPDRPEPDEPPAPSPPVPAELPKRKADPSRPSVPTRRTRWPGPPPAAEPPDHSGRPEPPGDSSPPEPPGTGPSVAGPSVAEPSVAEPSAAEPSAAEPPGTGPSVAEPSVAEPSSPPLPPELFHRLWWQEPPAPADPSRPSPDPGRPEPAPAAPGPPAEPSRDAALATRVRLWLRRRLGSARRR
jgi:hypothetical protein